MSNKITLVLVSLSISSLFIINTLHAQDTTSMNKGIIAAGVGVDEGVGIGVGLDYGAFGFNYLVYPQQNIGLFVGVGYAIAGVGYNVGAKFRLFSTQKKAKVNPFLIAMYGYYAAVDVTNDTRYNKLFYGATVGIGCNVFGNWSIELFVPERTPDVNNYINELKNTDHITVNQKLTPITFSIGYRF